MFCWIAALQAGRFILWHVLPVHQSAHNCQLEERPGWLPAGWPGWESVRVEELEAGEAAQRQPSSPAARAVG